MNTSDLAARILIRAADDLDRGATLTHPLGGHQVHVCMNDNLRDLVVRGIESAIGRVYGATARCAIRAAVLASLPPATGTKAEYADQLRSLAA